MLLLPGYFHGPVAMLSRLDCGSSDKLLPLFLLAVPSFGHRPSDLVVKLFARYLERHVVIFIMNRHNAPEVIRFENYCLDISFVLGYIK